MFLGPDPTLGKAHPKAQPPIPLPSAGLSTVHYLPPPTQISLYWRHWQHYTTFCDVCLCCFPSWHRIIWRPGLCRKLKLVNFAIIVNRCCLKSILLWLDATKVIIITRIVGIDKSGNCSSLLACVVVQSLCAEQLFSAEFYISTVIRPIGRIDVVYVVLYLYLISF